MSNINCARKSFRGNFIGENAEGRSIERPSAMEPLKYAQSQNPANASLTLLSHVFNLLACQSSIFDNQIKRKLIA